VLSKLPRASAKPRRHVSFKTKTSEGYFMHLDMWLNYVITQTHAKMEKQAE